MCAVLLNHTESLPMHSAHLILVNHHGALLLASSSASHHDHVRALLHHLKVLRHPLTHSEYHVLLGGILAMMHHLFDINHLMLLCLLDIDELMI